MHKVCSPGLSDQGGPLRSADICSDGNILQMTAFPHEDPDLVLTPQGLPQLKRPRRCWCLENRGPDGEMRKLVVAAFLPKLRAT